MKQTVVWWGGGGGSVDVLRAELLLRDPEAGWRTERTRVKFSKDQRRAWQPDNNLLQRYREWHCKAVGDRHAVVARESQKIRVFGRKLIAQGL